MDVELRHLRYFLAVAEELHFTRAAARLHMDQPALSRQVRRLEAEFGVPLFTRSHRRVELTPAGEHLRARAAAVIIDLDRALEEIRRQTYADPTRLRLRLGWLVPLRGQLIARLVRAFESESGASVELVRYDFTDPSAGLASGAVDAAIVNPPISTLGLEYQVVLEEPRVLIVASSHPLATRTSIRLTELDELDVLWAVPPSTDRVWQDYWTAADLPGRRAPARRSEYTENQDYLQAVAAGQVCGLTMTGAVGSGLSDYGIVAIPVEDLSRGTFAVAWRQQDPNPLLPCLARAAHTVANPDTLPGQVTSAAE